MKKQVSILMLLLFSVGASSQYIALTKDYKKLFNKRNISKIDRSLTERGWTKFNHITLADLLKDRPAMDYEMWIHEELKNKIFIFYSNGNWDKADQQFSYMYHNFLEGDNPINYFRNKRYYLMAQSQNEYDTLMFVFRN